MRRYHKIGEEIVESMEALRKMLEDLVPHIRLWKKSRRARKNIRRLLRRLQ